MFMMLIQSSEIGRQVCIFGKYFWKIMMDNTFRIQDIEVRCQPKNYYRVLGHAFSLLKLKLLSNAPRSAKLIQAFLS